VGRVSLLLAAAHAAVHAGLIAVWPLPHAGIISQLLLTLPHQFHGLHYIALVFYFLNLFLLTSFFLLSLARYLWFPW
jgi:hypothetical protein